MANRPDDDELTLYFYGEHPTPEELERRLATDPAAAARYAALRQDLAALGALEAPEPRPGLEARMWARVEPELARARERHRRLGPWLGWVGMAAAAAGIVVVAFLAGRGSQQHPAPGEQQTAAILEALPPEARERVLLAALGEHLASSEQLLVAVSNDSPSPDDERRWAEALLGANRLYRGAAERAGQRRVAAVLAELEPLLAELANAPADDPSHELLAARERIADRDLLFKVRVTRNNI